MDRRKAEARNQLRALKQESELTIDLLNKLVQICSKHVSDVEELDSKSFRVHSKYFLAILQFQSVCLQKIIECNIDLEEVLTEKAPANLNLFGIVNISTNANSVCSNEFDSGSESVSPTFCSPFDLYTSKTESTLAVNKAQCEIKTIVQNNAAKLSISLDKDVVVEKPIKLSEDKNSTDKPMPGAKIENDKYNEVIEPADKSLGTNSLVDVHGDDFQTPLNESSSSSEFFCSLSSFNDDKYQTDFEDASSYTKFSSDLEGQGKPERSSPSHISEGLQTLSTFNDDENLIDFENASSHAKFSSSLEEQAKPETSSTSNISQERLRTSSSLNDDENLTDFQVASLYTKFSSDLKEQANPESSSASNISQRRRTLSSFSDDENVTDFEDACSNTKFSDLEEQPKPESSSSSSFSERLRLQIKSSQNKFVESFPKAPMPDLTLRPVSELVTSKSDNSKQAVAVCSLTLENINKAFGSEGNKNLSKSIENGETTATKLREYKSTEHLLGIEDRRAPKVGDICMIGYVESPWEIYIQVADENSKSLDVLSMQLSTHYEDSSIVLTSKTEAWRKLGDFGTFCADGCYRVEILDWMLKTKQDEVLIELIDYGGKYTVNYKDLRPLDYQLRSLPRMAQVCHLAYLRPPGRLKEWTEQLNDGFFEILGNLDFTTFKIMHAYYCKKRKSYEIDLIKTDEIYEHKTIGQLLIDNRLAVGVKHSITDDVIKHQIQTAQGLCGITSETSAEHILDAYFQENPDEEAATLNEAVMDYDPQDEALTCRNLRPDGTCYKGKSCKFRHIPLRSGFTRDKQVVYDKAFTEEPLPCANDEIYVTISDVIDFRRFYAQIRRDHQYTGCSDAGPTLSNLIKTMNTDEMIKTYEGLRIDPIPGQMVIAKHWNGYWYRAQVRSDQILENNKGNVEVYFVDFGDIFEVPMSDLRTMQPDFLVMSFQAVECTLFNLKHKDGVDPIEARKHFQRQYLGQTFKAKIISGVPGYLEVLLENDNGEDIGMKVIEDGFGELNDYHCFPAEDERILID